MKPGEFDDLVRQKFDQADFEYNPRNWDKLTEELDGQKKKRGLLFWWMPLVGVAATVAMAFGVSKVMRIESHMGATGNQQVASIASQHKAKAAHAQVAMVAAPVDVIPAQVPSVGEDVANTNNDKSSSAFAAKPETKKADGVIINMGTALNAHTPAVETSNNIIKTFADEKDQLKKKKKITTSTPLYTFKEEADPKKKDSKVAIILNGGYNMGSQTSGYMVGATARRMINDKVYVESDIAFIGSNNTQKTQYMEKAGGTTAATSMTQNAGLAGKGPSAGKNTDESLKPTTVEPQGVMKTQDQVYNLYYAQVTPSIGYKLMKKLSIGVGPDFQQMLVDNRPEASTTDRGNIKVAPTFDIGFMGKTEYAISKNLKAGVYYREGINNVITPTNKYIDRNYLQVQIKCTILNR